MASIKLGAIITDIAGSIGGTTFRRTPRGIIAYNKQGTQIKSAFAPNSVKMQLGTILSSWALLTENEKTFWNQQAGIYQFPNKFGQLVNLTGRQFFTKLNAQLIPINTSVNAQNFDPVIEPGFPYELQCNWFGQSVNVLFSLNMPTSYGLFSIYPLRNGENAKPHLKTKPQGIAIGLPDANYNIWNDFSNSFPLAQEGQKYGVNVQTMNPSGFISSVATFTFVVGVDTV